MLLADAEPGTVVRLRGVVRAAGRTLRSKLQGESCVYWDVRVGLARAPEASEACTFWLEDEAGERVLVRSESLVVEVRAERGQELVSVAEADIDAVSVRIRELKDEAKRGGATQSEANRERKRLAKVATLLCAIRAEARGNVHLGGNLAGQRRWIEQNQHLADKGLGERTVQRMVERFEVMLREGDPVEVEGLLRREPMPGELGGGYRDRSDCLVMVPTADGAVRVRGVGEAAPVSERELRGEDDPVEKKPGPPLRTGMDPILAWTLLLVAAAIAIAYALR
ncbi:MAG: hypothetical protein H6722_30595 [Sandaracinus sp.]|nr:hypothetical protein [Sandaracinus sp.]